MTWAESKAFCEGLGTNMFVVESKAEKDEVTKMLTEVTARKARFWLGVKTVGNDWSHQTSLHSLGSWILSSGWGLCLVCS